MYNIVRTKLLFQEKNNGLHSISAQTVFFTGMIFLCLSFQNDNAFLFERIDAHHFEMTVIDFYRLIVDLF